jgi:hypothetical protein
MLLNESEVGSGVIDPGNALVFAEVDGENSAGGRGCGASCIGVKVHADRDTLRLPHSTARLDFSVGEVSHVSIQLFRAVECGDLWG